MKNLKYSLIVTIVSVLLTAFCTLLLNRLSEAKKDKQVAEDANRILITENVVYKDELGRTHTKVYQAKIDYEILKNSKDATDRKLYEYYSLMNKKDKKQTKAIGGGALKIHNTVPLSDWADTNLFEQSTKVSSFNDGYMQGWIIDAPDTSYMEYEYNDTLVVNYSLVKDRWRLKNLFKKRVAKPVIDANLTNPNGKLLDVRVFEK